MKRELGVLSVAIWLGAAGVSAFAQTAYTGAVPVPPIIAQAEGARQVGLIGGLSAWSIPGQEAIFILAPDGKSTIIGYVFDENGADIGAQLTGAGAVDLSEILKAQADIEAQALLAPEADAIASAPQFDPHLDQLTSHLDAAGSPEEFRAILQTWVDDLATQTAAIEGIAAQPAVDPAASIPATPVTPAVPVAAGAVAPSIAEQVAPAGTSALPAEQPAQSGMTAEDLLGAVEGNSFWFEVGAYDAPAVYAFIDPDCPFCARAILTLQDQVETGKLKLRVMLTPFLSDKSLAYTGAILTSADPEAPAPVAFWKHELERAYGSSSLTPLADLSQIPSELVDGIQTNIDLMVKAGIKGVPFFVYDTSAGAKTHFGLPVADQFHEALPVTE